MAREMSSITGRVPTARAVRSKPCTFPRQAARTSRISGTWDPPPPAAIGWGFISTAPTIRTLATTTSITAPRRSPRGWNRQGRKDVPTAGLNSPAVSFFGCLSLFPALIFPFFNAVIISLAKGTKNALTQEIQSARFTFRHRLHPECLWFCFEPAGDRHVRGDDSAGTE